MMNPVILQHLLYFMILGLLSAISISSHRLRVLPTSVVQIYRNDFNGGGDLPVIFDIYLEEVGRPSMV